MYFAVHIRFHVDLQLFMQSEVIYWDFYAVLLAFVVPTLSSFVIFFYMGGHVLNFRVFDKINPKNVNFWRFFMVFIIKMKVAPIFTIIFVITTLKYVSTRSLKKIRGMGFSEVYPRDRQEEIKQKIIALETNVQALRIMIDEIKKMLRHATFDSAQ